jgi:excisionase family DNA binding protein
MIIINNKKYYTPKEVANNFNVHTSTIARWRQKCGLKYHKINQRKFLFSEIDLKDFISGEK